MEILLITEYNLGDSICLLSHGNHYALIDVNCSQFVYIFSHIIDRNFASLRLRLRRLRFSLRFWLFG